MTPGLFFTGTDTDVGKTFVMAAVARHLHQQGFAVKVCKPIATGAQYIQQRWWSMDTVLLAESVGATDWERITPFTFVAPAAPPVAARQAGVTLALDDLVAAVQRQAADADVVLVEGVGGLLCPLTERETVADLAERLRWPLVVVARRSLGTLNHTLLTVAVAQQRGLRVAGVVVNETQPARGLAEETNVEELCKRLPIPVLTVVPHQVGSATGVASAIAAVDWQRLAHVNSWGEKETIR
ncbi:MAG: dethiobiotin synthase [Gemmataceae bacterium]